MSVPESDWSQVLEFYSFVDVYTVTIANVLGKVTVMRQLLLKPQTVSVCVQIKQIKDTVLIREL